MFLYKLNLIIGIGLLAFTLRSTEAQTFVKGEGGDGEVSRDVGRSLDDLLKSLRNNNFNSISSSSLEREHVSNNFSNDNDKNKIEYQEKSREINSTTHKHVHDGDHDHDHDSVESQIRQIALNNPEYRVMGTNKTQVQMNDDVGSRIMVALLNMQEEASDLFKQVSTSVESGFNDFKGSAQKMASSIEDLLTQKSQARSNSTTAPNQKNGTIKMTVLPPSNVVVQPGNTIERLLEQISSHITGNGNVNSATNSNGGPIAVESEMFGKQQAFYIASPETTPDELATSFVDQVSNLAKPEEEKSGLTKFLDTVGLTKDNQKSAQDALSNAGTATTDALSKAKGAAGDALSKASSATSDALSKAGTAIGDTITKDIPEQWNKIFG